MRDNDAVRQSPSEVKVELLQFIAKKIRNSICLYPVDVTGLLFNRRRNKTGNRETQYKERYFRCMLLTNL